MTGAKMDMLFFTRPVGMGSSLHDILADLTTVISFVVTCGNVDSCDVVIASLEHKEALNAATNEIRKSERHFEHKLAQNIKSDTKSFYAYARSKQNVRDKVGPLGANAGNIITQGFVMAEELNMHFSSVFTKEDTCSLPVPETNVNGSEGGNVGTLSCNRRSCS